MNHVGRFWLERWMVALVGSFLLGSLTAIGMSGPAIAADEARGSREFRPAAVKPPFQFTSSPVSLDEVDSVFWYGNTQLAYRMREEWYEHLQGFHSGVDLISRWNSRSRARSIVRVKSSRLTTSSMATRPGPETSLSTTATSLSCTDTP